MWPEHRRPVEPPDTLTPGDRLLAACLVLVGVVAGLVWASGQVAGLVFGHVWLHVDPAEVAGVLWRLPSQWVDPGLAWPAEARRVLPGPVGMYACFVVTTATVCGLAGGVLWLWRGTGPSPESTSARVGRSRRPPEGSAAWAGRGELRPLRVRHPEPGRVVLGRGGGLWGNLLAAEDCHSVLVFGPPVIFGQAPRWLPDQRRCIEDGVLDTA